MKRALSVVTAVLLCVPALAGARKPDDLRSEGSLKVGDPAPDFELKRLEEEGAVKLSGFKDKSPVVLVFGSYT